jgi:hypothetical protein
MTGALLWTEESEVWGVLEQRGESLPFLQHKLTFSAQIFVGIDMHDFLHDLAWE